VAKVGQKLDMCYLTCKGAWREDEQMGNSTQNFYSE